MNRREAWLSLAAGLIAVNASGCSLTGAGRSAGRGMIEGVHQRRDTVAQITGQVLDTVTGRITRSVRDSLRPEIRNLVAQATDTATLVLNGWATQLQSRLAAYVAGTLRDSLGSMVASTSVVAGNSIQRALRLWMGEITSGLRRDLPPSLGMATDSAVGHGLASVDAALQGRLRATVLNLVAAAADTVRLRAQQASDSITPGVFQRIRNLGAQVLIPMGLAILVAGGVVYWQFRKRQKILEVIATEIRNQGDETLKQSIKERAEQNKVEGDLNQFLRKRNLV
ncbi:MAG: hypothetical protein ACJ8BF_04225 [Gemmatimonadales bacterium]